MEFSVKSAHPEKQRTACIIAGVFEPRRPSESAEQLDSISDGFISNILRRGDLEGKLKQTLLLHNVPNTISDRILLVGCGKKRELSDKQFKEIIQQTIQSLNKTGSMEAVCFLTELNVKGRDIYWKVRLAVQTALETLYSFDTFKSKKDPSRRPLRRLTLTLPAKSDLKMGETAILEGTVIAECTKFTKDLANTPPNVCNPDYLAKQAEALAKEHASITCDIFETKKIQSLKMNTLLAVAKGSESPPKFITLSYTGTSKNTKPIIFVGKGVTFDTGGNSLKSPKNMIGMKYDMCGAATVLSLLLASARLKLPLNIMGIIPAVENMPGSKAARPDDIVTSMSGKTIEILNTDAEGRLILCDALTYCERFEPETVIDIATLTGACIIALGHHASGLYSNCKTLAHDLLNAGKFSLDHCWQMPLCEEYQEQLKSQFADLSNIGSDGSAGSITAACFLENFTKKYRWAHLDVAGTAGYFSGNRRGASGRPVPLLIEYLLEKTKTRS